MIVKGVKVFCDTTIFSVEEIERYIDYANSKIEHGQLSELKLTLQSDNHVQLDFKIFTPFERIRRITGYLSGDVTSWNDAKRSEERDRVKHN